MTIKNNNITIELESEDEIQDFWNIIMFALDLHHDKEKQNEPCMTKNELEMAEKLKKATEYRWI